ncbi:MAG: site-specific tyrosine recombinase XerD [Actinobacteria bacterium]|nr:site-specific tyrosine recombinase XerD [Actinomycetota bacterium]
MIDRYITQFTDCLRFEKLLSANTIISYKRDLNKFRSFIKNNKITDVTKITSIEILNFLEVLHKNQSESSVSRILSSLRSFYKYLVRDGISDRNPFSQIKNPKLHEKILETIDENEMLRFLDKIPDSTSLEVRDKAMFELLYSCGIRVSEIVGLRLHDIDFEENLVRFTGKGNKERIAPIGETAKFYLKNYLDHARYNIEREFKTDYFFLNKNGKKLTRQGFWKILKKYVKQLGIDKNLYPHLFRHSYATHMLERGADLRIVQELLGHSSISTTEIYTNISKKHIKDTYFKYHPRNKK